MAYSITATDANCYPGTTVLINKLGLKNQEELSQAEKISVAFREVELERKLFQNPFTFDFYCELHRYLFQDIYDWAGSLRTVDLSKKGTRFYSAEAIQRLGILKFQYLQEQNEFRDLPKAEFSSKIADFYHELNMLHPFREGNGRTQRLFFTLLIRRAGYQINFADCDMDFLMIATIHAAHGVQDQLRQFFEDSIHFPD